MPVQTGSTTPPRSLGALADVVGVDPDLVVVRQRQVGLVAGAAVRRHVGAGLVQRSPKRLCVGESFRPAWNPAKRPVV